MFNLISSISSMLYIDPAATSVLLSSITAICVAVGATFIVVWRKLKNKINKTLHIDPNAKKEVEDDLVITDETPSEATAEAETSKDETETAKVDTVNEKQNKKSNKQDK